LSTMSNAVHWSVDPESGRVRGFGRDLDPADPEADFEWSEKNDRPAEPEARVPLRLALRVVETTSGKPRKLENVASCPSFSVVAEGDKVVCRKSIPRDTAAVPLQIRRPRPCQVDGTGFVLPPRHRHTLRKPKDRHVAAPAGFRYVTEDDASLYDESTDPSNRSSNAELSSSFSSLLSTAAEGGSQKVRNVRQFLDIGLAPDRPPSRDLPVGYQPDYPAPRVEWISMPSLLSRPSSSQFSRPSSGKSSYFDAGKPGSRASSANRGGPRSRPSSSASSGRMWGVRPPTAPGFRIDIPAPKNGEIR